MLFAFTNLLQKWDEDLRPMLCFNDGIARERTRLDAQPAGTAFY